MAYLIATREGGFAPVSFAGFALVLAYGRRCCVDGSCLPGRLPSPATGFHRITEGQNKTLGSIPQRFAAFGWY